MQRLGVRSPQSCGTVQRDPGCHRGSAERQQRQVPARSGCSEQVSKRAAGQSPRPGQERPAPQQQGGRGQGRHHFITYFLHSS